MSTTRIDSYHDVANPQGAEMRAQVLAGLENMKEGRIKDLNEVCDRLEMKYRDAAIHH